MWAILISNSFALYWISCILYLDNITWMHAFGWWYYRKIRQKHHGLNMLTYAILIHVLEFYLVSKANNIKCAWAVQTPMYRRLKLENRQKSVLLYSMILLVLHTGYGMGSLLVISKEERKDGSLVHVKCMFYQDWLFDRLWLDDTFMIAGTWLSHIHKTIWTSIFIYPYNFAVQ